MAKNAATRVLMLLENSYYPRDARVRREAESLARHGFDVTVICPALKNQSKRELLNGVRVWRYTAPPEAHGLIGYALEYGYALAATLFLAVQLTVRYGVGVIHAANPPDLFVLIAALYKPFGVRFLYDQHDLAPEMYLARFARRRTNLVELLLRACERWSYRLADHVVVTNASYRENAIQRGNVPPGCISVVRNGPDDAQLDHRAVAIPGLSSTDAVTIAYLGLMGIQDGVDYLIRALHHLRNDLGRTDFRCLIIGSGEEQPRLEQLTRTLELELYVRFTGFIPDPAYIPYVLAADICVDPDPSSEYNDRSTMVKIMDYMTLAKPIVAFDLPETRRSAGDAALYVKPNDELEFAKALAHLMDHPEERRAMGALGRGRVERELSWSCSEKSLLRAYAALSSPHKQAVAICAPSNPEHDKC
jgi:glycosyltransferase involved in cell wall biosynthesis